ncbi:MAG: hypothetical protein AAGE43_13760, partial [Pseudomonadota bacterium]
MSDKRSNDSEDQAAAAGTEMANSAESSAQTDPAASQTDEPSAAEASVRRGGQILGLIIISSLSWYLLADRFT